MPDGSAEPTYRGCWSTTEVGTTAVGAGTTLGAGGSAGERGGVLGVADVAGGRVVPAGRSQVEVVGCHVDEAWVDARPDGRAERDRDAAVRVRGVHVGVVDVHHDVRAARDARRGEVVAR